MVRAITPVASAHPYSFLFISDNGERRRLQAALFVAAVAHAGFLMIVWPHQAAEPAREVIRATLQPLEDYIVRKPPPPPEPRVEKPRTPRKVPMPDAPPIETTMLEPLPIPVVNTPVEINLPAVNIPSPPAPPATAPPAPAELLRVGSAIAAPVRLIFVKPRYTEIARRARLEGMVILDMVIERDGAIREIKVLRGLALGLTDAAVTAVRQWRYEPTTVGGRTVPVRMTVTVRFGLQ